VYVAKIDVLEKSKAVRIFFWTQSL